VNPDTAHIALGKSIAQLTPVPQHPALRHLVESLQEKHGDCVAAVLFYGSCLRSGDPFDGLVDLYLIVDNYRCANSSRGKAFWNRVLPPNVFYAEFPCRENTIRCKYAILSLADLEKGTSPRWFHSYLWGRFSQPTAIAACRDDQVRQQLETCFAQAVITFLNRVLPNVTARGTIQSLWSEGLGLSYRAELRAESPARSRELSQANATFYEHATRLARPLLNYNISLAGDAYETAITSPRRFASRMGWALRITQGKFLSVARLLKAMFTFEGGLDYIAWKLERHSGVPVVIPEKVRRYPLIFIWGLFWDLYRRGIFR